MALLVVARAIKSRHPAFGLVAAFAEVAAICGLADWCAVVALFCRRLGLPIPHAATIPDNHHRIPAAKTFDGPINAALFEHWLETCLVPTLSPGEIVVMDNLPAHKGPRVERNSSRRRARSCDISQPTVLI